MPDIEPFTQAPVPAVGDVSEPVKLEPSLPVAVTTPFTSTDPDTVKLPITLPELLVRTQLAVLMTPAVVTNTLLQLPVAAPAKVTRQLPMNRGRVEPTGAAPATE